MIILLTLHRVAQDLVGLMDHVELVFRSLVVRIRVWMVLLGHPKVLRLDLLVGCSRRDTQELVVVSLPPREREGSPEGAPLLHLLLQKHIVVRAGPEMSQYCPEFTKHVVLVFLFIKIYCNGKKI